MKIQRFGLLASVAVVGSLALTACGSDNNTGATAGGSSSGGSSSSDCPTGTLNAEGSSAQKNAIDEAISAFQDTCSGATINYNPTGSGAGIKQFLAGQVDFAGSDSALKTTEKDGKIEADEAAKFCGSPAWNLPMVTGPIAVSYNVKGVDKLVLTPEVIANIFNGKVTTWNDASIAKINSGVTLPSEPIKVFFRSDESGTTENFTKYLNAAAPSAWTAEPAKAWTGKGEGKEKSAGVAGAVKSTEGGITYAEWSYAKDNQLGIAQIDNGAGAVELNGETVGKAIATAKADGEGNDLRLKLDYATKEAGAYPINLVTYEIVCSKGKDAAKSKLTKAFLKSFASKETQASLEEIGYAPLPDEVRTKVAAAIDALS
ncbi:phosphate ABC transporter substrate-binding protein PstS [Phycicoccus sp. Root101]|uniref:phosphate ABC transporter substrate-binding protein PstS n=1 Tax=Phycicoccus sp. Root101 TaxID=1736421 RepID=UPI000703008C|nr:phosphate ABC transporter substrate-binding protein PstS [Phycicoccus sp. Root101]KQU67431.1 phosphate-binding protein [Phycicoccus sp. Root101]